MYNATQLLIAAVFAAILGMTDSANIIAHVEHPDNAVINSDTELFVIGTFYAFSNDSIFNDTVVRDKLLISAFLPTGWTVNSVQCHIDTGAYRTMQRYMVGGILNLSDIAIKTLMDSLTPLSSSLFPDSEYDAALAANFPVNGRQLNSYVLTDSIIIPAGTPADTVYEDSTGFFNDIYIKLIGYYLKFSVTTGSSAETFQLGYFTGMAPGDIGGSNRDNTFSDSNIVVIHQPVSISNETYHTVPAVFKQNTLSTNGSIKFRVPAGFAGHTTRLTLYTTNGAIYGSTQVTVTGGINSVAASALTGLSGLPTGMYILRISMQGYENSQFVLLK